MTLYDFQGLQQQAGLQGLQQQAQLQGQNLSRHIFSPVQLAYPNISTAHGQCFISSILLTLTSNA